MIKVTQLEPPDDFDEQSQRWWDEFVQARERGVTSNKFWTSVRQRQKMKEYAERLASAFCHKCAFCESNMRHVSLAHIEHYRPKHRDEFHESMFDWHNWLLACSMCNSNKGVYFEYCADEPCLINPTVDMPSEHFYFLEAQILWKTERGQKTKDQIKLDRSILLDQRQRWLMQIMMLLLCTTIPALKPMARELLIWSMQEDAPYTAMVRCYLSKHAPGLANPETPHPRITLQDPLNRISAFIEENRDHLQNLS